jgi:hypothetical protein
MDIHDLLDKMEDAERRFIGTEFLAPIIGDGKVMVRIAGVICQLRITHGLPRGFKGWALLRASSVSQAAFVRQASLGEVEAYLRLFPMVRLILIQRRGDPWLAMSATQGDMRFRIQGPVILHLCEQGLERFETVISRFDGRLFWYERRDAMRNPALAAYLRDQLARKGQDGLSPKPEDLHKRGLSREEREAYSFIWMLMVQEAQDRVELRLRDALAHAGGELRDYIERDGAYVVRYEVDGRPHVSTIRQDDLSVMTAGICLAGQDRRFDLTSLVGVLREADQRGHLIWVGDEGLDEEQYWEIHPPDE